MNVERGSTLLINGAVGRPLEMVQRAGPLEVLVALVSPEEGADHATVSSADGQYRASIPLEWIRRGRLEQGRLVIPGAPTRCWQVKDVVSIEFTDGPRADSVRPGSFTTDPAES